MKIYDLIIIGAGPAGANAALIAYKKGLSVLLLEKGRELSKRKDLISGWFGKGMCDVVEDNDPLLNNSREIKKIQALTRRVSADGSVLAGYFWDKLQKNVDILFNSEVLKVEQNGNELSIHTVKNIFKGKCCLVSTGKFSLNWLNFLCASFKIKPAESEVKLGVRVEVPTFRIKDFKLDIEGVEDIRINSFVGEWEEADIMSSFGYNISDKKSHRTNFLIYVKLILSEALKVSRIINILANDRVRSERVFDYMTNKSIIKDIKQLGEIRNIIIKINEMVPSFSNFATMYVPEIKLIGILPVTAEMKTPIKNLYGAGECTCKVSNLVGALASGAIAIKTILKEQKND